MAFQASVQMVSCSAAANLPRGNRSPETALRISI
jgi:hypothetical protein